MKVLVIISILLPITICAQDEELIYQDQSLSVVLDDLHNRYNYVFHYSPNFIDLNMPVTTALRANGLEEDVLDMFEEHDIEYKQLAERAYILRASQIEEIEAPLSPPVNKPNEEPQDTSEQFDLREVYHISPVPSMDPGIIPYIEQYEISAFYITEIAYTRPIERTPWLENGIAAKVELFPGLSTEKFNPNTQAERLSVNLLWGSTDSLRGVELGTFQNTILHDGIGFQGAGIGNKVHGDFDGVQMAGLFNRINGRAHGIQFSGIGNRARYGNGIGQFGGIYNSASGKADIQAAGLINLADTVNTQVSLLFNGAKTVNHYQFGLINIADTVSGATIGLFNFVRNGYNHLDVYASEFSLFNVNFRFGSRRFHSILHTGFTPKADRYYRWSLGFGFGARMNVARSAYLDLSAVSIHVNENSSWYGHLNLVNSFNTLLSIRAFKAIEFFIGPSYNVHVFENRPEADPQSLGIEMTTFPWLLSEDVNRGNNGQNGLNSWMGFQIGIRI